MKKGFTLLEILLVIAAIGILAAIVIVAINPNRQLSQVRNADRESSSNTLSNALNQYLIDNGSFPAEVSTTETEVCNTGGLSSTDALGGIDCTGLIDLRVLVPDYVAAIPVEPQVTGDGAGYRIAQNYANTSVYVKPSTIEALSCPDGYIPVPGNRLFGTDDFCVMKYEAQNDGGTAVSVEGGSPWAFQEQNEAITHCENASANLMNNQEWMTIARNIEGVATNWTGGSVGTGSLFTGHSDLSPTSTLATDSDANPYSGTGDSDPSDQRRTFTLSNGEVIWDIAGNMAEFLFDTIDGADKPVGANPASVEWTSVTDYGILSYDDLRPSVDTWDSNQGVGLYRDGANSAIQYAYTRGGNFNSGSLYTTSFANDTITSASELGFRCVVR